MSVKEINNNQNENPDENILPHEILMDEDRRKEIEEEANQIETLLCHKTTSSSINLRKGKSEINSQSPYVKIFLHSKLSEKYLDIFQNLISDIHKTWKISIRKEIQNTSETFIVRNNNDEFLQTADEINNWENLEKVENELKIKKLRKMRGDFIEEGDNIEWEFGEKGHDSETKHTNSIEYKKKSSLIIDWD